MAYVDLATIQDTDPGDILTAAWCDQVRDNQEFFIDPPACSVFASANQTGIPDNTATALTADSEFYDNDSMHSTVSNTSRITAQTAGRYKLSTTVRFGTNQTGIRQVQFRINDTTSYNVGRHRPAGAGDTVISGVRDFVLAAGDYAEVLILGTWGQNGTVNLEEFAAMFLTR